MAIKNSISNDFVSTFVDSIDVFDCRLPSVVMAYVHIDGIFLVLVLSVLSSFAVIESWRLYFSCNIAFV